jgi:hypothetical protein
MSLRPPPPDNVRYTRATEALRVGFLKLENQLKGTMMERIAKQLLISIAVVALLFLIPIHIPKESVAARILSRCYHLLYALYRIVFCL